MNNSDRKPDEDLETPERGSHEKFLDALAAVPDAEPDPGDELPPGYKSKSGKSAD